MRCPHSAIWAGLMASAPFAKAIAPLWRLAPRPARGSGKLVTGRGDPPDDPAECCWSRAALPCLVDRRIEIAQIVVRQAALAAGIDALVVVAYQVGEVRAVGLAPHFGQEQRDGPGPQIRLAGPLVGRHRDVLARAFRARSLGILRAGAIFCAPLA